MARVTVEDCLTEVQNRFALVVLAARRARELREGKTPTVEKKNKEEIVALREIATGKVSYREDLQEILTNIYADVK